MSSPRSGQVDRALIGVGSLLFDFDGPLCDVFAGRSAPSVARRLEGIVGRRFDTDDPLVIMYECRRIADSGLADRVEDLLIGEEVAAIESARVNVAGVDAMLAGRDAGYRIAIVSNNSSDAVSRFLDVNNLVNVVGAVVGRHYRRPDLMKPNPWPLAHALELIDGSPARAVLIGDAVTDVEASKAAGVKCVALANKAGKREAFVRAAADAVIDDMAELGSAVRAVRGPG